MLHKEIVLTALAHGNTKPRGGVLNDNLGVALPFDSNSFIFIVKGKRPDPDIHSYIFSDTHSKESFLLAGTYFREVYVKNPAGKLYDRFNVTYEGPTPITMKEGSDRLLLSDLSRSYKKGSKIKVVKDEIYRISETQGDVISLAILKPHEVTSTFSTKCLTWHKPQIQPLWFEYSIASSLEVTRLIGEVREIVSEMTDDLRSV